MKKVFISQPMGGYTEEEILNKRNAIKKFLEDNNYEVIDSYFSDDETSPIILLGRSIELLADADIVYFVNGWELSRGCQVEHLVAKSYNIECTDDLESFLKEE